MVRLLLDTHALLWWMADDIRLESRARALIKDQANDVLVSVVVLWEIVVKVRVGKLRTDIAEISDAIERGGFSLLPIEVAHLQALTTLPMHHRDPFDHVMIAQAIAESATLVSNDRYIARYPVDVIACSGLATPG